MFKKFPRRPFPAQQNIVSFAIFCFKCYIALISFSQDLVGRIAGRAAAKVDTHRLHHFKSHLHQLPYLTKRHRGNQNLKTTLLTLEMSNINIKKHQSPRKHYLISRPNLSLP